MQDLQKLNAQLELSKSVSQVAENNRQASTALRVKYWEIIADNLKKAGWSLVWVSAVDCTGPVKLKYCSDAGKRTTKVL